MKNLFPNPPLFNQIALGILGNIIDGTFDEGEALPSLKELSQTYGVATNTAMQAVHLLKNNGLVSRQRGQKYLVQGNAIPLAITWISDDLEVNGIEVLFNYARLAGYTPQSMQNRYRDFLVKSQTPPKRG